MRIHRVSERGMERKGERESNLKHCQQLSPHFSRCSLSLSLALSHFACKCNGRRRISKMNPPKAVKGEQGEGEERRELGRRRLQRKLSFLVQEARILAASSAVVQVEPTATPPLSSPPAHPPSPCPLCSLCLADYAAGFACLIYVQKQARRFN